MEQLKKKLKTDEDLAWLDHAKTLDEQEVHEQDDVILRRRFFYSDQNVDSRDPIQLGVLYAQTRDAILSGTHPVTLEGACKFAGIQCQAQLGDFVEGRTTRPGYFMLRNFLPLEYAKVKHIERRIFQEHKKYYGLSELEAKSRYVSEARSLPTYGVTFFLVKDEVPGKNKLVPRLLGITKDCVMRVDADSKGILKTWPLNTVKRWAPSKNSFTLDFGDYSDSYYTVQTNEGEQISQLIAGYIDIILRRRKAKDHFGIEGDEGATMIEDSVAPSRATIIQATLSRPPSAAPSQVDLSSVAGPTVTKLKLEQGPHVEPPEFKPAVEVRGKAEIGFESGPITQYVTNYELSLPQRDLSDKLEQAQDAIEEAQKVLDKQPSELERARFEQSGHGVEAKKSELSRQFADMNAATAQLVSLSAIPEDELDYPALNQAVETVAKRLPTVAKDIKLYASLMEDEESGDRLIDAARRLCKEFSDLLIAAEPGPTVPRQTLISAASRVGDATHALLFIINEDQDESNSDQLLSRAKQVASSAAHLVLKVKDVASGCQDKQLQDQVIGSATQCALATSQMVATAKIVAPTIQDASCQRKLLDACREVRRAVEGIQQTACSRAITDETTKCNVNESVERVNQALDELIQCMNEIKRQQQGNRLINNQSRIISSSNRTLNSSKQTHSSNIIDSSSTSNKRDQQVAPEAEPNNELVNQARTLARATAKLIQDIRPDEQTNQQTRQSTHNDNNNYKQTISPSSDHRERIHRFHSSDPLDNNEQQHNKSSRTTTSTRTITTTLYNDEPAHRREGASPTPLMGGGESAYDAVEQRGSRNDLVSSTNHHYLNSTNEYQHDLEREPSDRQHANEHEQQDQYQQDMMQPEAAISGIVGDLETTIMFASTGTLRAQDENDNYLHHRQNVLKSAKALVEDTRPLVASSSSDRVQLERAASESVITLSKLSETIKLSAASLGPNQAESQVELMRSVKDVAESLRNLIGSTKSAVGCDSNDPRLMNVKESAQSMVTSVSSLLKTVKSVEEEQQRALRAIESTLEAIEQELVNYGNPRSQLEDEPNRKSSGRQLAEELTRVSRPVSMACSKTVHASSSGSQNDAIVAANMSRKAVVDLLECARSVSHQLDSFELRCRLHEAGRECSVSYKHLLELLLRIFQQPSLASANPEIKQELINESKNIASCVNELNQCSELIKEQQQQQTTTTTTTSSQISSSSHNNNNNSNINNNNPISSNVNNQTTTSSHWLDPHDPNLIAESELLGAASSIDAAAKKLENLKPRVTSVKVSF